jgi:hypothetical protein
LSAAAGLAAASRSAEQGELLPLEISVTGFNWAW